MSNQELQKFLYDQIPLARAMGVKIIEASEEQATLEAPLDSNSNHLDTAFGGSLGTLLILSCYTWLYQRMTLAGLSCHVLISESQTKYLNPVSTDLRATCHAPDEESFKTFLNFFQRKGVGRLKLKAYITTPDGKACEFSGEFVAQK